MIKHIKYLCCAVFALSTVAFSQEKVLLNLDFETPVSYIQGEDFSYEATDKGQSVKIVRNTKVHNSFWVPFQAEAGKDLVISFDSKGIGYLMVFGADKRSQCAGVSIGQTISALTEKADGWKKTGMNTTLDAWMHIEMYLNLATHTYKYTVTDGDGEVSESDEFTFPSDVLPGTLRIGNSYPIGNIAYLDNLKVASVTPRVAQAATGKIVVLENKFEKSNAIIRAAAPDFVIEQTDHDGGALKIIRNTKIHNAIMLPFRKSVSRNHDLNVSLDYKGIGYFFLVDAQKKQIGGVVFGSTLKMINVKADGYQGTGINSNPGEWIHVDVNFKLSEGTYTATVTAADGTVSTSNVFQLASDATPAMLQFGNSYPIGNVAYLDNLVVTSDVSNSTAGRENLISDDAIELTGIEKTGATPAGFNFKLTAPEAKIELAPNQQMCASLTKFVAQEGMKVSVLVENAGGQFADFAKEATGVYDVEKRKEYLRRATITITGKPGTTLTDFGIWTPYQGNAGTANRAFAEKLNADFELPAYEGNTPANLIVENKTQTAFPVFIEIVERRSKKVAQQKQAATLQPGMNKVAIPIESLPNGEYLVDVVDGAEGTGLKGRVERLLRRQVIPEPTKPQQLELTGKKLYLVDDFQLESNSNISFGQGVPTAYPLLDHPMTEDAYLQHGGAMSTDGKKLYVSFYTLNEAFETASSKSYCAVAENLDKPEKWTVYKYDDGVSVPAALEKPLRVLSRFHVPKAQKGADGREHWRPHTPADGVPAMSQVEMRCISSQQAGTLGYEKEAVWEGGLKPQARTHWPVWHKGPGQSLLLMKKPFLEDTAPGELEEGNETNDNYGGQWCSDDGKTFYYVHGRIVKRFEPMMVKYDNLYYINRLMTVFRTTDGVHYDRAYLDLPRLDEQKGTQHYGATPFRLKDGGPHFALVLKYFGADQRFCCDLAYSWDCFNWKHSPEKKVFLDNTGPRGWSAGCMHPSEEVFCINGKMYWLLNWQSTGYHFYGDLRKKEATGDKIKQFFKGRDLEQWPLFKYFDNDYDKLAEDMRKVTITPAVMVMRQDGFIYAQNAGAKTGTLTTLPITAQKDAAITINADIAKGGYVEVRLLDAGGKATAKKKIAAGDYVDKETGLKVPAGQFRVQCELKNAKLYTIGF